MDREEFSWIRRRLGKTQEEMAQLLGISSKAIQSFEQGRRRIPVYVERQALFLLAKGTSHNRGTTPCWVTLNCAIERRRHCPAWEFQSGDLCWFINGTICHGEVQESWHKKMRICRKCEVFRSMLPRLSE